jgi:methylated-DNA-[protein]-cysteine S-methyltransferase
MKTRIPKTDPAVVKRLRAALGDPAKSALTHSRVRLAKWLTDEAPLIQWGEMSSPLGRLYAAVSGRGLCAVDFGRGEAEFIERFDPRVHLKKNPQSVERVMAQLSEYFAGKRRRFDLPVDLSTLTPFQKTVLKITCRIAPGEVWTYHRVAEAMRRPRSSRPVGQALARNPVPIVIPCHRVIASNGALRGYSGGSGLNAKRWLLELEGAFE